MKLEEKCMLAKGHNIIDNITCLQNWDNETNSLKMAQHFKTHWTRGKSEKAWQKNGMKLKNHETSALKVVETNESK